MVEGIHAQDVAADAASLLEEVEQATDAFLVQGGDGEAQVGHAAVHVGQLGAELGHLVHLVHVLAGQEVQAVQVLFVRGHLQAVIGLLHGDDCLVDAAFAFLNPLAHAVQVGGEVHGGGEDAFVLLALGFAVQLLPPFADIMQFRVEVHEDFNFLAVLVELVACGGIEGGRILGKRNVLAASLLHGYGTGHQLLDVESGHGDGQQAHGGQYREASAYVVGDDERLVAFLVGRGAGSALLGVGDGYDDLTGRFLATLVFALLLQEAEGQGCLRGCSGLGYVDDAELLALQVFGQLV